MKPMTEKELLSDMGVQGLERAVDAVIEFLRRNGYEDASRELLSRRQSYHHFND